MRGTRRTLVITTLALSLGLMGYEAKAFDVVYSKDNAVRWSQNDIAFKIGQEVLENSDNQFGPNPESAIIASFDSWNGVSGSSLNFNYSGGTQTNSAGKDGENVVFTEKNNWTYGKGVIAITITTFKTDSGAIVDADIVLNDVDYDWTTVDPNDQSTLEGKVDIQNIVTHEIGHFIGLDHSSEEPFEEIDHLRDAAMFFSSFPGDISHRELNQDDEAGKLFLYTSANMAPPIIDEFTPTLTSNVESEVKIVIIGENFKNQSLVRFYNGNEKVTVVAKILEAKPNRLEAIANFVGQPTGDWDVIVENAHNSSDRINGALRVNGLQTSVAKAETSSGGCGSVNAPDQSLASAIIAFITLAVLALSRRKEEWIPVKNRVKKRR